MAEIGAKQPHELLLMLGGILAVLLSLVLTGVRWYPTIPTGTTLANQATGLVAVIVLGAALWVSSAIVRKNLMNGAIVAGVISLVLVWLGSQFGGNPGSTIGGVIGLIGAILAAAKPYLPWSRHE